jgi:hypothetical protein
MDERRIVLYGMPPLMVDILRDILDGRPGIKVVADVPEGGDLVAVVKERDASDVVARLHGTDMPPACDDLIDDRVRLRVVGLSDEGLDGCLYRLRSERSTLGGFSRDAFLAALEAEHPA